MFPLATLFVFANGLIPCFSKCPPNGFAAACKIVEVGK